VMIHKPPPMQEENTPVPHSASRCHQAGSEQHGRSRSQILGENGDNLDEPPIYRTPLKGNAIAISSS